MGYNPLINGIYWGYNPFTNYLLTSWHIQVKLAASWHLKMELGIRIFSGELLVFFLGGEGNFHRPGISSHCFWLIFHEPWNSQKPATSCLKEKWYEFLCFVPGRGCFCVVFVPLWPSANGWLFLLLWGPVVWDSKRGFPPFHKGIQSEPPKPLAETWLFDDFLLKLCTASRRSS